MIAFYDVSDCHPSKGAYGAKEESFMSMGTVCLVLPILLRLDLPI